MQKSFLWAGLLTAGIAVGVVGYALINRDFRDWQHNYSEKRVNASIVKNYHLQKSNFKNLIEYTSQLNSFPCITFLEDKSIRCLVSRGTVFKDSSYIDISFYTELSPPVKNIILLDNQSVQLQFSDTIITLNHWIWNFEGSKATFGYDFVLDVLKMKEHQIDSLRMFLQKIDCEAVGVENNGAIHIRFDGIELCQYEYVVSSNFNYPGYKNIENNVYYGLNRSPLFCGNMIWKK